jgi:hypothetical protein
LLKKADVDAFAGGPTAVQGPGGKDAWCFVFYEREGRVALKVMTAPADSPEEARAMAASTNGTVVPNLGDGASREDARGMDGARECSVRAAKGRLLLSLTTKGEQCDSATLEPLARAALARLR